MTHHLSVNANAVSNEAVRDFVEQNIGDFHSKRVDKLNGLKLKELLRRKNPYLFRAKAIETAQGLIEPMLDAYLSSQEETIFGNFLEGLARRVCEIARNGRVSGIEGVDLEFDDASTRYIISLKSGPNWGNSSQVRRMRDDFVRAARILRQGNTSLNVQAVNGCCYGRTTRNFDRGDYWKLAGQEFWQLLTDEADFYTRIVKPMAHRAKERNGEFVTAYGGVLNRFVAEFLADFATADYKIDWNRLVEFNSKSAV